MTEKFEEKLWGRIDFLHEKYRKDYTRLQNFGEILTKFQNACQDFAKSLNNAINKKYKIIEEKPSTMYNLIQSLMVYYSQHVTEYTETYTIIKTRIIGPVIQVMDDLYSKEKFFISVKILLENLTLVILCFSSIEPLSFIFIFWSLFLFKSSFTIEE